MLFFELYMIIFCYIVFIWKILIVEIFVLGVFLRMCYLIEVWG